MAKGKNKSRKRGLEGEKLKRPYLAADNPNKIRLGPNRIPFKKNLDNNTNSNTPLSKAEKRKKKKMKLKTNKEHKAASDPDSAPAPLPPATVSELLTFFLHQFQSSTGVKFSHLELESIKDTCIVELSQDLPQDMKFLSEHMKAAFGTSWEEVLCETRLSEGKIGQGSPALIGISTSAMGSIELLRGLRPFTGECRAAKLFPKDMKMQDHVASLKRRVNIACGTPSRIRQLMDIDALVLERPAVILLDMRKDVKGYNLLTLPQVSDQFLEMYRIYFHRRLIQGDVRLCLYGSDPKEIRDGCGPKEIKNAINHS